MNRREYTKQFKQEAIELSYRQSVPKTAKALGVAPNMLYRWRGAAKQEGPEAFRGNGKIVISYAKWLLGLEKITSKQAKSGG